MINIPENLSISEENQMVYKLIQGLLIKESEYEQINKKLQYEKNMEEIEMKQNSVRRGSNL